MSIDELKQQFMNASKGQFTDVMGDKEEGEWLTSPAWDLNRILSGSLWHSVRTLTHTGLVGPETSGKSSIMALILADAQKKGYLPVIIDAEGAWDANFVKRWGLDPENIIRIKTMFVDKIEPELSRLIDKGIQNLAFAVDSIGALELYKIVDDVTKPGGDDVKADQGRLQKEIKRMLKMIVQIVKTQNGVAFSAGHYYGNPTGYGEPEKIGGGNYYRLACDNLVTLKKNPIYENPSAKKKADKGKVIGNEITAATLKNRHYPAFQEARVEIDFRKGVNSLAGLVPVAREMGLIEASGAWFTCSSLDLKVQGEQNFYNALKETNITPLLEQIEEVLKNTGYSTINEQLEMHLSEEMTSEEKSENKE